MFKRVVGLLTIASFVFAMSFVGCSTKERTIAGPTEYDTLTVTIHDTVTVVDSVDIVSPMHAYAVATVILDPVVTNYLEQTYSIIVTEFLGNYNGFKSSVTKITRKNNTFTIAGTCMPLFYFRGDTAQYFDIVEFSDLALTYNGGDPTNSSNWSGEWASSTAIFKAHAMKVTR